MRSDTSLTPWVPKSGEWNRAAVDHLLARAEFGASPERIAEALDAGFEASVAGVVADAAALPDPAEYGMLMSLGEIEFAEAWWLERLAGGLEGRAPGVLRERTTLMWHDHFATSNAKVDDPGLMVLQNRTLREHALGDFRELLRAMLVDPAMLVWLDGSLNRKGRPNENLARELFELFALGIGNYSESDVLEAARALSGWNVKGRAAVFAERWFDDGIKSVLGESGSFGVDELVELTVQHPACSRFVARKLARTFVEPEPSGENVAELAAELVAQDWRIDTTLETLFASRWFNDARVRRSRIAGPVEFIARAWRQLGGGPPPRMLARAAAAMGQQLFAPPSVEGWHDHRSWIGAATLIERERAAMALAESAVDRSVLGSTELVENVALRILPGIEPPAWTQAMRRALDSSDVTSPERMAIAAALTSPEAQLV